MARLVRRCQAQTMQAKERAQIGPAAIEPARLQPHARRDMPGFLRCSAGELYSTCHPGCRKGHWPEGEKPTIRSRLGLGLPVLTLQCAPFVFKLSEQPCNPRHG